MSDFTIEQLEALKEGTRYAPWRPEYDEGEDHWVIAFDHPKFGGRWEIGIAYVEGAAKAFTAAPALVDALIAEKQAHAKLRAEVEEQRDVYAEDGDSIGASQEEQLTFEAHRQVARDLTRILEATDE